MVSRIGRRRSARPPATPTTRPTAICRENTSTTTQNVLSACVASSIRPSMRAIPTGSLAPDSPSRIVRARPGICRPRSTENITAGSVGATAAPSRPDVVQPSPNPQWQAHVTTPAVTNVPATPSDAIGAAEARNRPQPIDAPPSKRMTTRATVAIHSTARTDGRSAGTASDAIAAATRRYAAGGTRIRLKKSPYFSIIGGIIRQERLLLFMRRLCLTLLVGLVAVPTAVAASRAAGDGVLELRAVYA